MNEFFPFGFKLGVFCFAKCHFRKEFELISIMFELQLQLSTSIFPAIVGCLIVAVMSTESFTVSDFLSDRIESTRKPPQKPPDNTKVKPHKSIRKSIIWTTATFILADLRNVEATFGGNHATTRGDGKVLQRTNTSTQLFRAQFDCANH